MAKKTKKKVCGFASCSDGEEGGRGRDEVDPKSREKGDAGKED